MQDKAGELAPEVSETLTHYTTFVILKFFTGTPNLHRHPNTMSGAVA